MWLEQILLHEGFLFTFKNTYDENAFKVFVLKYGVVYLIYTLVLLTFKWKRFKAIAALIRKMPKFFIASVLYIQLLTLALLDITHSTKTFDGNRCLGLSLMDEVLHVVFAFKMFLLHDRRSILVDH